MLKLIKEANKNSVSDRYGSLFSKIRELDDRFKDLRDTTLNNILTVYWKDAGIVKDKVVPEDFLEWFDLSGSIGEFILDFAESLSAYSLGELGQKDPKFVKAVYKVARDNGYITKDGYENVKGSPSSAKVDFPELIRWLFTDANLKAVDKLKDTDAKTPLMKLSDKTTFNFEDLKDMVKAIKDAYKTIKEDFEETDEVPTEEIPTEVPAEEVSQDQKDDEIQKEYAQDGIKYAINTLTQKLWDIISQINSIVTTVKSENIGSEKSEDLIKILDAVIDDLTIDLGMINRTSTLLDDKAFKLIDKGTEKASKLISEV